MNFTGCCTYKEKMLNATNVNSGPSMLYQYIAIKWKEGLNLFITSMNICLLIFALIVACVRWCKIRSWRSLKIFSYINILLSLTMYNALKMFLEFFGPVPKTFLIDFLTRLSVSSFTSWFLIMSWITFWNPVYPIVWACFLASALGWNSAVGYSALFTYSGGGLVFSAVVAVALTYVLHVRNVYIFIKILTNGKKYNNLCEILRMLLYSTDAFIILVSLHVSEFVPEWSDTMWLCILTVQVISPIVYICTGELCKLYYILLDKDNTERYIENRTFAFQFLFNGRYICPLIIRYYGVEEIGKPQARQRKARRVPYQDGKPKASKAGCLLYYQDDKRVASNATPRCECECHDMIPYYQDSKHKASNVTIVPYYYYQHGKPKASNVTPKCECPNMIPYYEDGKRKASDMTIVPYYYYQDDKPKASNVTPKCECPNMIPYYEDGKPKASNATIVPYYYYQDEKPKASNVTPKCECHNVIPYDQDTKF